MRMACSCSSICAIACWELGSGEPSELSDDRSRASETAKKTDLKKPTFTSGVGLASGLEGKDEAEAELGQVGERLRLRLRLRQGSDPKCRRRSRATRTF